MKASIPSTIKFQFDITKAVKLFQSCWFTKAKIICGNNFAFYPISFQFLQGLQQRGNTAHGNKGYANEKFITIIKLRFQ